MWYSAHALWRRTTSDCHLPAVTPQRDSHVAHGQNE